jgi:hypothetical protein
MQGLETSRSKLRLFCSRNISKELRMMRKMMMRKRRK